MITPFASTPHGDLGAKLAVYGQQSVNDAVNFLGISYQAPEKIGFFSFVIPAKAGIPTSNHDAPARSRPSPG
jgi:hypothetical protein